MFRKINNWLHLWLGLLSGIIVFIVCITGCIWVFNDEITALIEPNTRIEKQNKPILLPSQLQDIAHKQYPNLKPTYVTYQQDRTIHLALSEKAPNKDKSKAQGKGRGRGAGAILKINPYTGEIISDRPVKAGETDFFRFILNGHRFLWLPVEIGRPIVNYGTLIFVVLLITGLIWWWPKKWNKKTREKSFTIKWGASFKRVNLDLHNVLGFYSLLFLLAIALTGMVWGIEWYSNGLYWATSGGKTLPERTMLQSDSLQANKLYKPEQAIDIAFQQVMDENPKAGGFYYTYPDTARVKSTIMVIAYPNKGQFYNSRQYNFDQHTLKPLEGNKVYASKFEEAPFGDKLRKMNYDIHVGSILGFSGKVLAFCVTLIGASLPITGFLVWWGRKFGKKKKRKNKRQAQLNDGNIKNDNPSKFIKQPTVPILQAVIKVPDNKTQN